MLDDEREESASVEPDSSRGAMMATCHCGRASKANGGRTCGVPTEFPRICESPRGGSSEGGY
jgi:hypothetical protein